MSNAIKQQLQQHILTKLKDEGVSKGAFANQLGISQTRLSIILHQNPSIEKLIELLEYLGCEVKVDVRL